MEFPVIRIELDNIKQNIAIMFNQNNNELNKMVQEAQKYIDKINE